MIFTITNLSNVDLLEVKKGETRITQTVSTIEDNQRLMLAEPQRRPKNQWFVATHPKFEFRQGVNNAFNCHLIIYSREDPPEKQKLAAATSPTLADIRPELAYEYTIKYTPKNANLT